MGTCIISETSILVKAEPSYYNSAPRHGGCIVISIDFLNRR
jgi:hypothetical protein